MQTRKIVLLSAGLAALWTSSVHAEQIATPDDTAERAVDILNAEHMPTHGSWQISWGIDFSRGNYGAATATDVFYFPVGITYRRSRWTFSLDTGVVSLNGPVDYASLLDLTPDDIAALRLDTTPLSVSGMADVTAGIKFAALEIFESGTFVDVGARLKLPTASQSKGLGNGNFSGDLQLDITQLAGAWTLFLSGTYGIRDHANGDRDTHGVSFGFGRPLTERFSAGLIYDWRTSPRAGGIAAQQGLAYVACDLTRKFAVMIYGAHGLSQTSPDAEAGLRFTWRL